MFNNYVFYKIFIFLFFSFLSVSCGVNNVNTKATLTTNNNIVITPPEQFVNIKEGETFRFVFKLNRASALDVSFDWSVQHISTSAEDFTGALAGTQLIRAGDTIATISIDTSDDSAYETDENFSLNITNITGAASSSLAASGSIIDNDPQPNLALLSFEQDYLSATEDASLNYKLELNKASVTNVSFDWSVQHISTSAEDFTGALAGSQLIRAGDTIATISIDTSDDSIYETDEIFSLNITNVTGAAPSSLAASGRIIDNDPQPSLALLSFEQDYSITAEGTSFNYRLQISKVSATNVSFDWSVQHISTSAEDFTGALAGTQLIRAGDTIATISIDTSDDSAYETDEIFSLNITNVTGAAPSSLATSSAIIDNDPQPNLALLSFEQGYLSATEDASLNYKLELNRVSATNVSFDWSVQHISTSAEDFTGALAGTQLIRAGDTIATISIDTSDDSAYETDEIFSLNITNVTGATPSSLAASGRIIDNDPQPSIAVLSFEQDYSITAEGTSFNYRLQISKVSATNVSFDWSVQHISTSAEDFTGALAGTQLIRAGDTIATISIDTSDDSAYETDEIFSLNITNVTGAAPSSLATSSAIIDNDPQPNLALLSFEQDYLSATEDASLNYKLELNRVSATNVSFDWSVQHISTSAEDFTGALAGTQLIRAGDTIATISIDTSDDSAYETDEIFSLNITNVTGATPSSLAASGRIIDNDPQPSIAVLSFEQDYLSATEDASLNYKLELNKASVTNVSFDWSVQHISTSAEDFTGALAGTQLIRAGDTIATISIDTSDDSIYETDEIFSLNITNVTGAAPSSLAASGRIIDNDPQPSLALLSFEQDYLSATEDASLNYKLELNRVSATNVSFDWSVQHISTSAEDFTGALVGTQLIRAGDTIATISIDTSDDSIYETDEIFSLNITNVTGAAPSSLAASGRIIDNDPQPSLALLSFEQDYLSATEDASLNYKLELNKASVTNVSFDWSVQHISTSAEDFTGALAGTQLIRAGDTIATISIDTSDDSIYETDEIFSLNITNVTGAAPSSLAASGRIIDNDPQPSLALLSFEQVDATTTEGASFTYKLELNRASALDVSFDWSVQHISTSTEDFTGALAGTQLIRAGDTTTTISIDTSDDSIYETDEIFSLNITNVTGATSNNLATSSTIIDNDPQPSLALLSFEQDYLSATEDASLNYKLELNKASVTNVSFDWSVQHISTSAEDFTGALAGTQLIRAGDTTITISIDTSDDSAYETDEIFSLNITNVTGAAPSSLAASGRIIDNDPQPNLALLSFEQVDATTTEGASFTYKLELNRASALDVSFDWSVQHISTSTSDFTGALAGTQLIRAGDTIATISIDTSDDSAYETDEIFSLNITNVTGAAPSSLATSSAIIDNDPQPNLALLSFEQVDATTTEGASFTYKLELNRASALDVSFDWSVQHISTSTEDFTGALAGTQLIRAGDTTATISIDTSDDSIYETDENFSFNITNVTGAAPSSLATSSAIIDNDPQPSLALLSFEQVDATTTEGASFTYKLELNRASALDVSFDWSVQHISTSTSDFTGALAGTQLIRAGDTTITISIDTSDDSIYETDEIFSLNITNVTGAAPSSLATSSAIIDNDPQPNLALLSFEQVDATTTEGASFTYKLELNRASALDVSFDWSVQHISTSTEDFTGALAGTQLIRAGDTTATISIDTSDDSIYETDENFSFNITNVTGAAPSSLATSSAIIDNDPQPSLALLSFEQVDATTTEGASFTYKLELNRASALDVSFDWSVQHISTSTSDFTGALAGTQLIRAGDTTITISIDTSDDSIYETDEIFSLNITNVTGAAPSSLATSSAIIDNDPQPNLALLSFEQVDATTTEGASFTYKLELNRASALDVSFDWSVQHISTSTEDFTGALAGTQLIRAGDTTATISIDTSDDSIYETDENFSFNITNVTGAAPSSLATSSAIIDNDPQPSLALLSFEQVDATTTEGASFTYKLELNRASALDVSFDWSVQHISTSTSDFTGALAGTQLIRAGDTTITISIDTSDDSIYETDEIFSLNITNVTGAAPSSLAASGRIIDNDPQPSLALLSFEQDYLSATEDASLNYKLELNKVSATNVSFDWSVQHISTSTEDFTGALAGTQLIRAGDTTITISIDTSDDSIYETDEIFSLNITNVTGAAPSSLAASGRIIDNDPQPSLALLSFEQVDATTTEGASFTYKLELNKASALDVSFDWSVQHISTSAEDFTGALAGTQLIRAGDTIATISIDTSDDSAYETDEIFSLNITNVTGAAPSSLATSSAIIDNDPQPNLALLSFEQVDATTTEGASFTYKLELNRASALDVSFDWSVQHISTSTEDFTGALVGTQLIRVGDTTATISIDTSDDSIYETDEIFSLNITNVTGATSNNLATSSTIIDNDPQPSLALLSFEQDYLSATEDASLNYKLELNKASVTNVSFDWSVQHISTSAEDFTGALAGTQLIRAGDTIATISIDTSDDSIYETDENFILNITNVTGAAPSSLAARGRIIDNDPQPSLALLSFEQVDTTTTEGASFTYKLELNRASALDVSFYWSVQHISTSAEDFTGATFGAKILFAGDTTAAIELQINDDDRPEQIEGFTLNITNIRGATPDSLSASIIILENDLDITVDYNGNGLIDIVTQEHLDNIRYNLAGTSYKTSTNDVGKTCNGNICRGYELLSNLDLNTLTNWQPIGSENQPFTSIFAGNGYSITNIVIDGVDYLGLFATLSDATIDNLVVEVVSINGDNYVGALAGRATSSIINKVQVRAANTNSKLSATGARVGGMLGAMTATTITNVISDLNVVKDYDNTDNVGGIVGYVLSGSISYVTSNGSVFVSGSFVNSVGGLAGAIRSVIISYSSASGSVISSGSNNSDYGGLVGKMDGFGSTIRYSSASGSVTSNGTNSDHYGGLVGRLIGPISYSSASGSVTSNGTNSDYYGGLVGYVFFSSTIRYSSASGSVISSGDRNDYYGGLVGAAQETSKISYISASGNVISSGSNSNYYGGLIGDSDAEVKHSWSSSSVFASSTAGLVSRNIGSLKFSYALGAVLPSGFGLITENRKPPELKIGSVDNSYWNSETSGSLNVAVVDVIGTNIASSDIAGMLDSTGSAEARIFKGFAGASDEFGDNIWTFTNGSYPVITELGVDKQAVALAYGLLRLAHPTTSDGLNSFLGATLNNEDIELIANNYNANDTLAILDVNLLASNSATCAAGSTDTILTTTGANGATITLQKIAGSIDIEKRAGNSCDIIFSNQKTDGTLQLAAIISKGAASLTKKFEITLNAIQSIISLQPTTLSTREGDNLVFTLELNHRAHRDISFDWSVEHSSTSTSDFTGARSGFEEISAGDTTATIELQINDDDRPELAEDFTLNITNIRGITHNNLSASIIILENDLDITVDYNGNGLIDIVTQENLDNIRYNLAGTSYKTSTNDVGKTCNGNICRGYELLSNLDLSTLTNWQSIGSENQPFTSIFAGNGYSITNLVIDGVDYLGLFATLSGATIDNLVVEIVSISGDSYVGALAGRATTSTISRIRIRAANTNSKLSATGARVGGMLGAMTATTITNVTSDLSIAGGNNEIADNVGGIVGYVSSSDISYAYSSGSVSAGGGADNVGGLVGFLNKQSIISDSSASGSMTSSGDNSDNYGGLVGYVNVDSAISYSSASGSMTSNGDNSDNYGGLVGYVNVDSAISYSSASGSMTSNGDNSDNYGGLVGYVNVDSAISYSSASGSMTSNGDNSARYGGLVGFLNRKSIIRYSSASGGVTSNGGTSNRYGGLVGFLNRKSIIRYSSASGGVTSNGGTSNRYGGLVGFLSKQSIISDSSASASVTSNGGTSNRYGGLVGFLNKQSIISYSSASGSVSSNGNENKYYGGLVGSLDISSDLSYISASGNVSSSGDSNHLYGGLVGEMKNSTISYSSASGNVSSSGTGNQYYGGLAGFININSKILYASTSGNVIGNGHDSNNYGGLIGYSNGEVRHSWSSSSVSSGSRTAGLVSLSTRYLGFSYVIGTALNGLVLFNAGVLINSYWNIETSGALEAADFIGTSVNIASSDTASMLASTGSAGARIFKGFADATDEHNRKIWTFTSGSYPVITELGVDKQAVALAYGLLRFASPNVGASTLDSFLGATLNNENIELIANSYNANDTLAILDVNLLAINSATCAAGSGDIIMTTTGANGTTIVLQKIAGSIEIKKRAGDSCEIIFSNQKTDGTLQLAAIISKGAASLSKKFAITLKNIQSRIALQPTTLSTREGDELVFTLELNHKARRNIAFDWSVQHQSTSTSDFTGAIFGAKTILADGTDATIRLQINDDNRPENAEDFTLNITNIRGVTHNNFSASITILENDLTVDYNGNGLIDLVTEERLGNIRYNLAGTSYKTSASDAGTNCGGSACRGYELFGNLDLSAFANWQPIGSQNDPFTTILQGNGYSITNLVIDRGNNIGLFAALSGATIDNLVVEVVSITGDSDVGALAGRAENSAISRVQIRAVDVNSKLQATGARVGGMLGETIGTTITNVTSDLSIVGGNRDNADNVGGIVGYVSGSTISYAYSSGSVSTGSGADSVGGLVGELSHSTIDYSSTSGEVTNNGGSSNYYGGLVGFLRRSTIRYSSTSASVTSNGDYSDNYGGLVGHVFPGSKIRYSSASGSVISSGNNSDNYGGLVGSLFFEATISYSSASGSVISSGNNSDNYGGLVGQLAFGTVMHSWSSSSVFASSTAGLVSSKSGRLGFSYALGVASYGLVATNSEIITNSYWNSETSGALKATDATDNIINIASSDTAGMLASTGSAEARIFKGFADATDEHNRNIWTFASDSYPVITELGVDKQAVALAYGLLRLASPNVGASTLDSFLGGTLNNEAIALDVADYNTGSTLAILDVNLLQSNSTPCIVGSGGSIITTTGANQAVVTLSVTSATNNLHERIVYTGCNIGFDGAASISAGDRLQLATIITKGSASLSKKFVISFR